MRLFAASSVSDSEALSRLLAETDRQQAQIIRCVPDGKLRWMPPDQRHVTWHFLGERPEGDLPALCDAIEQALAGFSRPKLSFGRLRIWPNVNRPQTLVLAGDDQGGGEKLALGLANVLSGGKNRPFRPHVTLGRFRNGSPPAKDLAACLDMVQPQATACWTVEQVTLFKSTLTEARAIHEPLARFRLQDDSSR